MSNTGNGNNKTIKSTISHHTNNILLLTGMKNCTPKDTTYIQTIIGPYIDDILQRK